MRPIDLRSDTVTRPTPAMREAIARAEVGDDVYGEDPSVNRLQAEAAQLLGKEAAIFVPSGSMANQAAILAQTAPGDLVLAGRNAHTLRYEAGAAAGLAGVQIEMIGEAGLFEAEDVRGALNPPDHHYMPVRLVTVENTHNTSGGRVFPLDAIKGIAGVARERDLALHMDGARLFNAVVATGTPADVWAEPFDSVSFCLSKGLGAPVGSLVCGSAALVDRVHRYRKMLGGGMRQAGVLAAAGLYALEHHIDRLAEDHANARRLAEGLRERGLEVAGDPQTNMVLFRVGDDAQAAAFAEGIRSRELLINPIAPGLFRAVLHLDVSADDVEDALGRIDEVVAAR